MSRSVISLEAVRAIALALPDAVEADHWGKPSFRMGGRIFATVPDPIHLNVMVDPIDAEAVVRAAPEACAELFWGKEVRGVTVDLRRASRRLVGDLLEAAWRRRAPRRLSAAAEAKRSRSHGHREGPARR